MYRLLTIILVLVAFQVNAQSKTLPVDTATKKITFSEVVTVDGVSKDELYKRAKNLGVDGKSTVTDNPAEGVYTYKGQIKVTYPAPQPGLYHNGVVDYTVTLAVKDGRYKFIITNFTHSGDKANGGKLEGSQPECGKYTLTLAGWGTIKNSTKDQMYKFIATLKARMANTDPNAPKIGTDW